MKRNSLSMALIPICLVKTVNASSADVKILVFLDAKLLVRAATIGGTRAPDWMAKDGMIRGRHCRA